MLIKDELIIDGGSACLSASFGDKEFFRCANILQIADVVRRVVFLLFLPCFLKIFCLETSKMSRHFVLATKTTQTHPQVFWGNGSIICQFCCMIEVISSISQNSFTFGQQYLVMMNYAWDFSQSDTEKYFEWIIKQLLGEDFVWCGII